MCGVGVYVRRDWCTRNCTVFEEERRVDSERFSKFVLPRDRGLEYVSLKELPKNLGDYNCLLIGI